MIQGLQPDVAAVLDSIALLEWPRLETLPVAEAREFALGTLTGRPPGPEVGEVVDGKLKGAASELDYRLYRPARPGPHPIVVYFHGGGWVLGSSTVDDPFCRDLCVRSGVIILSVDYRHAPEAPFPAAPEDGLASIRWVSENAASLGGVPAQLAVGGWSAGANIAAVVCQMARDTGGPEIAGQLLVAPVTNADLATRSYQVNGDGYLLTRAMMEWFWDKYIADKDRKNAYASPLQADSLQGLPPAMVVTCEFDPLRDEGVAYAKRLKEAGVQTSHLPCAGHVHSSLTMIDIVLSGASARQSMAAALRGFF